MRIRYFRCCVVRDAMMKIPREGPAWELPVLKAMYGAGNLEDVQYFEVDAPEPLPPGDELMRLTKAYGREKRGDGSAGDDYATIAYGRGDVGESALQSFMEKAIVTDEPKGKKGKKGKKGADAPPDDGEGDSA